MFIVYILYSARFKKTYVGYTADLAARLLSHNILAKKGFTNKFRPWVLIHSEEFDSKSGAMKREKFYKSGTGREAIKLMINNLNSN